MAAPEKQADRTDYRGRRAQNFSGGTSLADYTRRGNEEGVESLVPADAAFGRTIASFFSDIFVHHNVRTVGPRFPPKCSFTFDAMGLKNLSLVALTENSITDGALSDNYVVVGS